MANERKETVADRRVAILTSVALELKRSAYDAQKKSIETMKSKAGVDGPWQSKQPDEMIKIELQARIHQEQAVGYREKSDEIHALLTNNYNNDGKAKVGSVLVWKMQDPEHEEPIEETVIITPSGGGEFGEYRLLSEKAPLTREIIGKSAGDTVEFGEITVAIRELL